MNPSERQALLETSLTRAAELLGDITPMVMARYYARFPEALEHFEYHGLGDRESLEGEMVEQILYCLLDYLQSRGAIEIMLLGTVPHHIQTLKIPATLFHGLLDCLCDVVAETIPADSTNERRVLEDLHASLKALVDRGDAMAMESAAHWPAGSSKLASP